ncbi:hypothetical protein QE152_g5714 [Popillia japonica]|uniref:Uncharacterized protein n=1 Tax=Popillia japonica TaxID=7064 RepID=A0AAW1MLY2_POPJA
MQERFLKDNRDWLGASILFPRSQTRRGRPENLFVFSVERTKRHKTSESRKSTPLAVLSYATQMSMRASGKAQASKVIQEITTSPKRGIKYRRHMKRYLKVNNDKCYQAKMHWQCCWMLNYRDVNMKLSEKKPQKSFHHIKCFKWQSKNATQNQIALRSHPLLQKSVSKLWP